MRYIGYSLLSGIVFLALGEHFGRTAEFWRKFTNLLPWVLSVAVVIGGFAGLLWFAWGPR